MKRSREINTTEKISPQDNGLEFFGRISAMISHELKNSLAIMNENAGLLEDLVLMEKRGKPLNSKRLETLAADLTKQIDRSNETLNGLNFFAHSIDEELTEINAGELLDKFSLLSARYMNQKGIQAEILDSARNIQLRTNIYFMLNLLWLLIEIIVQQRSADFSITFDADENDDVVLMKITSAAFNSDFYNNFTSYEYVSNIIAKLNILCEYQEQDNTLIFIIHKTEGAS